MNSTKVKPETYIRAETDRQFGIVAKMAGGVNKVFHFRRPTPLDKQNIVRMNRDTLYSMAVVDTSKGATICVPAFPKAATCRFICGQRSLLPLRHLRQRHARAAQGHQVPGRRGAHPGFQPAKTRTRSP